MIITHTCGHTDDVAKYNAVSAQKTLCLSCRYEAAAADQEASKARASARIAAEQAAAYAALLASEARRAGSQGERDTIFATDSSDDARLPATLTETDRAEVAALHAEAQERVAQMRAFHAQEDAENSVW